jgi:hypothetical protein
MKGLTSIDLRMRSRVGMKIAFDNEKYIKEQSAEIIERAKN